MKLKKQSILRICAAAAFAIGLVWTALNVSRAAGHQSRMRTKIKVIAGLQEMKKKNDLLEASFALLQTTSNSAPSPAGLAAAAGGATPEIREIETLAMGRGWNVKRTEVTFREINLDILADFLRAAETQRPPLRLEKCVITSSQKTDGYGTVVLTMETLPH